MIRVTPARKKERNPRSEKTMLGKVPTQNAQRMRRIPGRK